MGNNQVNRRDFLKLTGCGMSSLFLSIMGFSGATNAITNNKLGPASPDRPNILLMVMDTVRSESLSVYDYKKPTTPQLEKLAKSGVLFNRAISTSPWTLPTHASMFTGHYPFELSTGFYKPLDRTFPTLAEELGNNGYETAGFVANNWYGNWEFGLDRGFDHYEDHRITSETVLLSSALAAEISRKLKIEENLHTYNNFGRKSAEQVRLDLFRWLDRRNSSKPFFAFLNFFDAHEPYLAPKKYTSIFTDKIPLSNYPPDLSETLDPIALEELNTAYDAGIAYIDDQIGLIVDSLEKKEMIDNTIIIIVSDHGELFGEHGTVGHGKNLYMKLIHVPLMVIFPGRIPQDTVIKTPVSLVDLPATVMSLTNMHSVFPGKSLDRYWAGNSIPDLIRSQVILDHPDHADHSPMGNWESLVMDKYHYIKQPDGIEELFDFSVDPLELNNLAKSIDVKDKLDYFRTQLTRI